MTKKMFFVFSLCCFMLSYSHFAMASASVISPIKTEKSVISPPKISPQKKGIKCTFTLGPFIVFVGDDGTGTISLPFELAPAGFIEWELSITDFWGDVLCSIFSRP